MAVDPTHPFFAGTARDRAAFEAGIKLGAIVHQFVGTPVTPATAADLERAIESSARLQPGVVDVRARIDRERLEVRGPYAYGTLTEDLLHVEVSVRIGGATAVGVLRYIPELDYPLMYLKDVGGPAKG